MIKISTLLIFQRIQPWDLLPQTPLFRTFKIVPAFRTPNDRGRQGEAIFQEAKDCETFLQKVSSVVERMKANLGRDKRVAGKVRSLVPLIIKSQEQT